MATPFWTAAIHRRFSLAQAFMPGDVEMNPPLELEPLWGRPTTTPLARLGIGIYTSHKRRRNKDFREHPALPVSWVRRGVSWVFCEKQSDSIDSSRLRGAFCLKMCRYQCPLGGEGPGVRACCGQNADCS